MPDNAFDSDTVERAARALRVRQREHWTGAKTKDR